MYIYISLSIHSYLQADLAAGKLCAQGMAGLDEEPCKSSLFRGVSWHKHSQKWYAYIQHAGKMRGLGYFHNQQDAAAVYDAEAVKVRGLPYSDPPAQCRCSSANNARRWSFACRSMVGRLS